MQAANPGAGPYVGAWPDDPRLDHSLLAQGDRRNVADEYRYWKIEAIKQALEEKAVPLEIAIENWQHDFNIGSIVRTANAFNVGAVHIVGKRHWNRRGAMVTDRYITIKQHATVESFQRLVKDKTLVVVDNIPGAAPLNQTNLPKDAVLVFGGEGPGVSSEMRAAAKMTVMIEQFGSTRSINVGAAAAIVMYAWLKQHYLTKSKELP